MYVHVYASILGDLNHGKSVYLLLLTLRTRLNAWERLERVGKQNSIFQELRKICKSLGLFLG